VADQVSFPVMSALHFSTGLAGLCGQTRAGAASSGMKKANSVIMVCHIYVTTG
jgi:hypothetical protein